MLGLILLLWLAPPSPHKPPAATCGIAIVSYRFEGEPGTTFVYAGVTYVVPATGWIELLAKRRSMKAVAANGVPIVLDAWPVDQFGTRHVPLPRRSADPKQSAEAYPQSTTTSAGHE